MLTRDRNLDVANDNLITENLWRDTSDDIAVEIGIADTGAIYNMLSDLSANKGAYVLREAYSNAYDATMRAGDMTKVIEIEISQSATSKSLATKLYGATASAPVVKITDHGCGMSADTVANYFLQYGGSDKRDEIDAIGSKGLGSKAPLAVTESFTVETTKDGITTSAIVERKRDTAGEARLSVERTGKPSGTTISIPVADPDVLQQMNDFLDSMQRTACDIPLIINGERVSDTLPTEIGAVGAGYVYVGRINIQNDANPCYVRLWEPFGSDRKYTRNSSHYGGYQFPILYDTQDKLPIDVLIGGCTYELFRERYNASSPVIVGMDAGWLDFTPSRDEVKQNAVRDEVKNAIQNALKGFDYTDALKAHFNHVGREVMLEFLSKMENVDADASTHRRFSFNPAVETEFRYTVAPYDIHDGDAAITVIANHHANITRAGFANYMHTHPYAHIKISDLTKFGITADAFETDEFDTRLDCRIFRETELGRSSRYTLSYLSYSKSSDLKKSEISTASRFHPLSNKSYTSHRDLMSLSQSLGIGRSLIVTTGIDDDKKLRYALNKCNAIRTLLHNQGKNVDKCVYLTCESTDSLPEYLTEILANTNTHTVSYDELRQFALQIARQNREATRLRKQAAAGGDSVADTSLWYEAEHTFVTGARIPDGSVAELLSFINDGETAFQTLPARGHYSAHETYVSKFATNAHTLENCVVVCDSEHRIDKRLWQTIIALLWKHKRDFFAVKPEYVLFLENKIKASTVKLLASLGATFAVDHRPKFKTHVSHTLVAEHPLSIKAQGSCVYLSTEAMFGNERDLARAWWLMANPANSFAEVPNGEATPCFSTRDVILAALAYDLTKNVKLADDHTIHETLKPIFDLRGNVASVYSNAQTALWKSTSTDTQGYNRGSITPWSSSLRLIGKPAGADEVLKAAVAFADAIRPLAKIFDSPLRYPNSPISDEVLASAELIGPAIWSEISRRQTEEISK